MSPVNSVVVLLPSTSSWIYSPSVSSTLVADFSLVLPPSSPTDHISAALVSRPFYADRFDVELPHAPGFGSASPAAALETVLVARETAGERSSSDPR